MALARLDPESVVSLPPASPQPDTPEAHKKKILSFNDGQLVIDGLSRALCVNDQDIEFSRREFDLLYFLASNNRMVLPRSVIFLAVWGDNIERENDRNVDTHVHRARTKLGEGIKKSIVTRKGYGYGFDDRNITQPGM